jgi:hypothetical protein
MHAMRIQIGSKRLTGDCRRNPDTFGHQLNQKVSTTVK